MKKNNLYTISVIFRVLIVIILLLTFDNLFAQPNKQYYGCKNAHHHHQHKSPPLTPAQQLQLTTSNERSDTLDILHYNINLDFRQFSSATISGFCEITVQSKMDNVSSITLDLLMFDIDSVEASGSLLEYNYDGNFLTVQFPNIINVEEEFSFSVHYHGNPTTAASGFGGLAFQNGIAYNLGIGLGETPYNYGRGWFPCFDTFVERSTFEFNIISNNNKRAYCVGTFMGEDSLDVGTVMRSYELSQQIPTYLAGIAVGDFSSWQSTHTGEFGEVPLEILALPNNINTVVNSFQYLDESVDALEKWWGQYPWERVGYVMTGNGAMEHPTNVAYPLSLANQGATPTHNEVMAHELGHHWWGNVVTLTGPENMWIKEGPAEYSAHLFYEHVFGKESFVDVVKENLLFVLKEAHVNDEGYQALSPMPYEQTYGTHTYQKGALVLHNLRGYLGDSLFRVGMKSVLAEYAYDAINAEQFRDQLTLATGIDLAPYFDAWIFAPGYSAFEIDDLSANFNPDFGNFDVNINVQQKLHAATVFHEEVPMVFTFMSENFERYQQKVILSGEFSEVNFVVPFEPVSVFMNGDHDLNLAVIGSQNTITEEGPSGITYVNLAAIIEDIQDSVFLRLEEYRVAPDPSPSNVYDARLSENHYWRVTGVFKEGFVAKGTFTYDKNFLDSDLVSETEDSLILLYRPDPTSDWYEYPDYSIQTFGSIPDGYGVVRAEPLRIGEYTFANGVVPATSNEAIFLKETDWTIFPNPAAEQIFINGKISKNGEYRVAIYDWNGKNILEENMEVVNEEFYITINLQNLPNGVYAVKIVDEKGKEWGSRQVEVLK